MAVFSSIFVASTKITLVSNFVASLIMLKNLEENYVWATLINVKPLVCFSLPLSHAYTHAYINRLYITS